MSLWSLVGISTRVDSTATSITLAEPAGVTAGDLLIANISYRSAVALTAPSTVWANANTQNTGNTTVNATGSIASARMDYTIRTSTGAPGLQWTSTGGDLKCGSILAYRRTDGGVPVFDQVSANTLAAASATVISTGITTVEDGELLVMLGAGASNVTWSAEAAATDPAAASWTEHGDGGTTLGADGSLMVASAVKDNAGATGQFSATASASRRHAMIVAAFRARYNVLASQGSYALTGNPVMAGVERTYVTSVRDGAFTGSATKTFSSVSIGTAAADRYVAINLGYLGAGLGLAAGPALSVTIGGISATKAIGVSDPGSVFVNEWWYAAVPTGTSGNIVITFTNTETGGNDIEVYVYALYGADTSNPIFDTATDADAASTTLNASIDIPATGAILGAVWGGVDTGSPASVAWTNLVEDVEDNPPGFNVGRSAASYWSYSAESNRSVTAVITLPSPGALNCTLALISITPPRTAVSITAAQGSYSLNGQAVTVRRAATVAIARGSYTLNGQSVALAHSYTLTANQGSYTLSGRDVTFARGSGVIAAQGSYALTGRDVTLIQARPASPGAYTLTGGSVTLRWSGEPQPPPPPTSGGGGIGPMLGKGFRTRKEKSRPQHVIRIGEWPEPPDPEEIARKEAREFSQFMAGLEGPEELRHLDEEEKALTLILSML
jgi:hypothetical protein